MDRKILFLVAVLDMSSLSAQTPVNLKTDLMSDTETVWCGGYATNASLQDAATAMERANKKQVSHIPYQVTAIGSTHPALSWELPCGQGQRAYRILMSTSREKLKEGEADVWDSGMVESDRMVSIVAEGKELEPGKIYFWTVKVWNDKGEESPYSTPRSFITAQQTGGDFPRYPLTKTCEKPTRMHKDSAWEADFGRAAYGQLLLTVRSEQGDTLTIRLGEAQKDGRVNRKPGASIRYTEYRMPVQSGTHQYRLAFKPDERNAMIKPHGQDVRPILMPDYIGEVFPFRYCEIEGKQDAEIVDLSRESVHYRWDEQASFFHSSDTVLNQVWELCKYSIQMTSFCGVYVDGDRERIPYEADALINQLSHYCTDQDFSMARYSVDYLLHNATWPTEWILQALILAWNDYMYTGDATLLERNYDILKARTLVEMTQENGLISTRKGEQSKELLKRCGYYGREIRDIVDWPQSGALGIGKEEAGEADGYELGDFNTVVNAFHYRALDLMGNIAEVLGKSGDATEFRTRATQVKDAINRLLLNTRDGWYTDGLGTEHHSLHASMFPLAFGIVPEKQKTKIIHHIQSRGMACSVYGAQFLLDALYEAEEQDYALQLLTSTGERGWYNMLRTGSTVTLEAWDAKFKPNLDWNHAWGATPANIIPRQLMGIQPLEPGWKRMRIKPQPGKLAFASIQVPTILGAVKTKFEQGEGNFRMNVEIPSGTEAEIWLPLTGKKQKVAVNGQTRNYTRNGRHAILCLPSGTYELSVRASGD